MSIKHYVLPDERKQMREEAVKQAMVSIDGPVILYEHWLGESPHLTVTDGALRDLRSFCQQIWDENVQRGTCRLELEQQFSDCSESRIVLCHCGVHNVICPVRDVYGGRLFLLGGGFIVRERKAEAEAKLATFLQSAPVQQREGLLEAWRRIPEVGEDEVLGHKLRELELAGRYYLNSMRQQSDFRYRADLMTHDVGIALQALIGEIEVLKIELKDTFGIGKVWERRFESLIGMCEDHLTNLERGLGLDKYQYEHKSIHKLMHKCLDAYRAKAEARGIQFRVDLENYRNERGKYQVLTIRMDQVALKKALLNVIDNAVKYSFGGTASHPRWIEVAGRLESREKVPGYIVEIRNFGIGIDPDELQLVFEPGYQGRRRLGEERSGFGMGLAFVKECVERHGGCVTIQSEPSSITGWLTTLCIWLPLNGPLDVES